MKKFRFKADYRKKGEEVWTKIDKILKLNEDEQALIKESKLKFLVQQCKNGNLPLEGMYEGVCVEGPLE